MKPKCKKKWSPSSLKYFKTQSYQMFRQKKRNPDKFRDEQLARVDKFLNGESVLMENNRIGKTGLIQRYKNWEQEAKKRQTDNFIKDVKRPKFKPKVVVRKNSLNKT